MVSNTATEQGDRTPGQSETPHTPGETGLWVFLLGDMVVFVVMFVAFLAERAVEPNLFTTSRESVSLVIALTNTMILLVSSLAVVIALNHVRADRFTPAVRAFAVALLCAVAFIGFKATEYTHLVSGGHGPDSNAYFMWLFILTGVHLAHVVLGVGVLTALLLRARRGVRATGTGRIVYEGGACYWHLVDLLWMMLFPLVYLVA